MAAPPRQRDLHQIEPLQRARRDQRFRPILDVVQADPLPRQMMMPRVGFTLPDPVQPVRAKHRSHPLPRLIKVGRVKQPVRLQRGDVHRRSSS